MMIQGRTDGCIGAELTEGMAAFFPRGLKIEIIDGAGHFVHQEKPEVANRLILLGFFDDLFDEVPSPGCAAYLRDVFTREIESAPV